MDSYQPNATPPSEITFYKNCSNLFWRCNGKQRCESSHSLDLSDGNDGSRFDGTRLGLVGDQFAQERNQHDERNTDYEAADAELGEKFRVAGVGGDRCAASR